jgi:hypothetical protein
LQRLADRKNLSIAQYIAQQETHDLQHEAANSPDKHEVMAANTDIANTIHQIPAHKLEHYKARAEAKGISIEEYMLHRVQKKGQKQQNGKQEDTDKHINGDTVKVDPNLTKEEMRIYFGDLEAEKQAKKGKKNAHKERKMHFQAQLTYEELHKRGKTHGQGGSATKEDILAARRAAKREMKKMKKEAKKSGELKGAKREAWMHRGKVRI